MPHPPATRPPAVAPEMTVCDLLQIETWARHGLDLETIAALMGLSWQAFQIAGKKDPRIYNSFTYGRVSGAQQIAAVLFDMAKSGRDVSAARLYLQCIVRGDWTPKAASSTITIITPYVPADIDQEAMAARFARQRRLIDGTADELRDGPPSPPEVPPDPPGKG